MSVGSGAKSVNDWRVLVTRTAARSGELARTLETAGVAVDLLPVLRIELVSDPIAVWNALEWANLCVFVSVHAVEATTMAVSPATLADFPTPEFAAVGDATADALRNSGASVHFMPVSGIGSEGLIESLSSRAIKDHNVAIFAAETGRQLLDQWLNEHGATVRRIVCYRRTPEPAVDQQAFNRFLGVPQRLVVLTSVENMTALLALADKARERDKLLASDVLAISARVAQASRDAEFHGDLSVASAASSAGLAESAIAHLRSRGAH